VKIKTIRIENFRSFKDETISLDDYNGFVGQNGAGKSTILTALNIFFRETANSATDLLNLKCEDFHACDTSQPIRITVTFDELSPEAKSEFQHYVRQDRLIVSAVAEWNDSGSAQVKQFGQRRGIEKFRKYFERLKANAKADELKSIYADFQQEYTELPNVSTKAKMEEVLHRFEESHPEICSPLESEDEFYGISRGANRLQNYIQWVYVPAVKDATTEHAKVKDSAFHKLLKRRVHSQISLEGPIDDLTRSALDHYQEILEQNTAPLNELALALNRRFQQWAHQDAGVSISWEQTEESVSISEPTALIKAFEGEFEGELARFGHGLQRSLIFALLQELAQHDYSSGPKLILGVEEPELYQHPAQARYLSSVFQKLSKQNSQVLICTHSPYFVSGKAFENIRVVHKDRQGGCSAVRQTTFNEVANEIARATGEQPMKVGGLTAKVEQEMQSQMSEMFFASVRVFVEGLEDIAYVNSYLALTGKLDEFRSLGCHLVQTQGKSHLIEALAISKCLKLPSFTIFDADGNQTDPNKRTRHQKDNFAILELYELLNPNPFPQGTFWHDNLTIWESTIGEVIETEIGQANWQRLGNQVRSKYNINEPKMAKNSLFIGYLMTEAWEEDLKSPTLIKLCEQILTYARSHGASSSPSNSNATT
jgi:putative ATP-dependent endonuclease of the OLD family